jgi:hypothetical protein
MSKLDTWIDNKVVQNLFIWFCLFLILMGTIQSDNRFLTTGAIILLLAPAVYINNLFILPLFNKNRWRFLFFFIVNTIVFTCITIFILVTIIDLEFRWTMFLNFFGILILALTFGSAVKISRDSFIRRQEEKTAELKLLKAQLNPHFLFNTLNNLYGLSVVKSDKLPNLMLKLSDLLRYSVYDTKETYVDLEKELQYLENYMSLEKIRLEETTVIQFIKNGDLGSKKIAPMLFIVFVENAFKHLGTSKEEKSKVIVAIEGTASQLILKCENTTDGVGAGENNLEAGKSGIGLKNAKKRLALLYPEKHQLTIVEKDNTYSVTLILDL